MLRTLRRIVRASAPRATEKISYGIPHYDHHGRLIYFAAFKDHIGMFPPVRGDERLETALAPYRGPKGNLRFPLAAPIPYRLIERIVRLRVKQDQARSAARRRRR